ncbi:MAG: hypothetical protein K6B68_05745 [Eubacterium sp.]|nr:hypothetical protein [Eubacterium sp.]
MDNYLTIKEVFPNRNDKTRFKSTKSLLLSLCNLLYGIRVTDKDKKLLWKAFKGNKKFLKALDVRKKDFTLSTMHLISNALDYKYNQKKG